MAKYLIHTMPKRMWYVEEYLIPSMVDQGIEKENIKIYNDEKGEGNLKAFIKSGELCKNEFEGTWHLQDDVIISHDFKKKTEQYDEGIVCGFKSRYDGQLKPGETTVEKMWFSFPCIRIPNMIFVNCVEWIQKYMIGNPIYKDWWEKGVNDDLFFRKYVWDNHKGMRALNLSPNIVDHIDYLIGGTVNSNSRKIVIVRSEYWEDENLVNELEKSLKQRF